MSTNREREVERVYGIICAYCRSHCGLTPTRKTLQRLTGINSTAVIQSHVKQLAIEGRIKLTDGGRIEMPDMRWLILPADGDATTAQLVRSVVELGLTAVEGNRHEASI